jgi:predicted nucleic acid-binding protein
MTEGGKVFLDTNLFVYSVDIRDAEKHKRSRQVVAAVGRAHTGVVSTQVMQELFSALLRKLRHTPLEAKETVQRLSAFETVLVSPAIIERAMDCVLLYSISFWDALIVAAAAAANCRVLLTEDLQHGQSLLGVRIENPLL